MRLKHKPTPEEEAAFIAGAKADQAENPVSKNKKDEEIVIDESKDIAPEVISKPTQSKQKTATADPHAYIRRTEWPILPSFEPVMADGREDLDKPFVMRMKENLWCSIDRHCKALGVDKSKWIRQAILNQMAAEQQYFVRLSKKA